MPSLREDPDSFSRRRFLQLMSASIALAGLQSCTRMPREKIIPFVRGWEGLTPGIPSQYATVLTRGGDSRGILVRCNEGRPTHVDGNPDHPSSLGGTDVWMQAEVLSLYDPNRLRQPRFGTELSTWDGFLADVVRKSAVWSSTRGRGVRLLTGAVSSPSLEMAIGEFLKKYPEARWHIHEPISPDRENRVRAIYDLSQADIIVSLDSDFLLTEPRNLVLAREFIRGRKPSTRNMNRLYMADCSVSITGAMADHRIAVSPAGLRRIAFELASGVGLAEKRGSSAWSRLACSELLENRGRSVVLCGHTQPSEVHAIATAINHRLGNVGKTVRYAEAPARPQSSDLRSLVEELRSGAATDLIVLGANPVYTAPVDLGFDSALSRVPWSVCLSESEDETSRLCSWRLPKAHPFEGWGDARSYDGTLSIQQPMVAPFHDGKSELEILSLLLGDTTTSAYSIVRHRWSAVTDWNALLERGAFRDIALKEIAPASLTGSSLRSEELSQDRLELAFRADSSVWDGRYSGNAWLQELPRPITTLSWDNALQIGPQTAAKRGLSSGDVVELRNGNYRVEAPILVDPRHPENSVTAPLGYGRAYAGPIGSHVGFNAYSVRTVDHEWNAPNVTLRKTGGSHLFAFTQKHHQMDGRSLARFGTVRLWESDPARIVGTRPENPSTVPAGPPLPASPNAAWGMSIDLNSCIGCNACIVACQSENNIPVVGREQVLRGREMHWLRVDSYFERGTTLFQPVPCMHCEKAPCEVVCPTEATVHNEEGLNQMIYNRCVGTRYCSNNCPYKVRRFNFLTYPEKLYPSRLSGKNPEVTVRSRGVMEKCSYCVQRINHARIRAEIDNRPVRDGEVITACQASCPTEAIIFGNLSDPHSKIVAAKKDPREYALLEELGTKPRTTYQVRLTHPKEGAPA